MSDATLLEVRGLEKHFPLKGGAFGGGASGLGSWDQPPDEAKLKDELGVTVRCIPIDGPDDPGPCILSGKPATRRVVFAKAY